MVFDVCGKVAFITGGADGIGYQYVLNLLENGAKGVAIIDINEENGIRAENYCNEKFPNRVKFFKTDVSVESQLNESFQKTIHHFKNLDIVINNAGISDSPRWQREIEVNFNAVIRGTMMAMETYLPKYRSTAEGVIVNTSSVSAIRPFSSVPVYSAEKSGILNLGRAYGHHAIYNKFGNKVITICPGVTVTKMITSSGIAYLPEIVDDDIKDLKTQSVESIGNYLSKIIKHGENGSAWMVDGGEAYKLNFPTLEEIKSASVKENW